MLDSCYVIDFVEGVEGGPSDKFTASVAAQYPHLKVLTEAFTANGINHWRGGTGFHAANSAMTKVVDLALKDEYSDGQEAIALAE